ncbi:hypothetical protein INT43_004075 [Umbelopsis isabellina]|uniref:Uncharacterized protein n=1 Tax=Mortierella isabellina TaxID=91625 RepID=A0A8H7PW49_MORIS|nr:hypothetical protein INT43_004075 [Umbelopsis isabellina]
MSSIHQALPRPFTKLPLHTTTKEHACPCSTCGTSVRPPMITAPAITNKSQTLPSIKSLDLMNHIPHPTKRCPEVPPSARRCNKRHQRSISMPEGRQMTRPSMSDLLNAIDLDQRMSSFYQDEVVKTAAREQGRLLARMMASPSQPASPYPQRWSMRRSPVERSHRRTVSYQSQLPSPPTSPVPSHRRIRYVSVDSADQAVQRHLEYSRRRQ